MRDLFQVGDRFQLSQGEWSDYHASEVYIVKTAFSLSEMLNKAEEAVRNDPDFIRLQKVIVKPDHILEWLLSNLDLDRVKVTEIWLGFVKYEKPDIT